VEDHALHHRYARILCSQLARFAPRLSHHLPATQLPIFIFAM
jgi:hypothetical protein